MKTNKELYIEFNIDNPSIEWLSNFKGSNQHGMIIIFEYDQDLIWSSESLIAGGMQQQPGKVQRLKI